MNINRSIKLQVFILLPFVVLVQLYLLKYSILEVKLFLLSLYMLLLVNTPLFDKMKSFKVPSKYQEFIIIIFGLFLFIMTLNGFFHRTYVGFILLVLILYVRDKKTFILILLMLYFNNNKVTFITGSIYYMLYLNSQFNLKNKIYIFVKYFFSTIIITIFTVILYYKMSHWIGQDIENIHALNHRLTNIITFYELMNDDFIKVLFPFNFLLINPDGLAMDNGYLVAIYRSGLIVAFVSLYFFLKNITYVYGSKSLVVFTVPLLTQAAYLNYIILLVFIIILLLFHARKGKK
jgi:hypothetical protein